MKRKFLVIAAMLALGLSACQKDRPIMDVLHTVFTEEELTVDAHQFNKSSIRITTFGHIYPLLKYPKILDEFMATVKAQNPDYVFILGDMVFNNYDDEWETMLSAYSKFGCPVYYAPGNHDLNFHSERGIGDTKHQFEAERRYLEMIGYRYKLVKDNFANYLFLNLNDSLARLEGFINKMNPLIEESKLTIVLSHQNIWSDYVATEDPETWRLKKMRMEQLMPSLINAKCFFNGDWTHSFVEKEVTYMSRNYKAYSVGNKLAGDQFYITNIQVFDNEIEVDTVHIPIPKKSTWYDN